MRQTPESRPLLRSRHGHHFRPQHKWFSVSFHYCVSGLVHNHSDIIQAHVHSSHHFPRKAVCKRVVLPELPNACAKLRDGSKLTLLTPRPWLCSLSHDKDQRRRRWTGNHPPELPCGEKEVKKLPVKGTLFPLFVSKLPTEEGKRLSSTSHPLLANCCYSIVRSIRHEG